MMHKFATAFEVVRDIMIMNSFFSCYSFANHINHQIKLLLPLCGKKLKASCHHTLLNFVVITTKRSLV